MKPAAQNLGRVALGFALAFALRENRAAEESAAAKPPPPNADAIDVAKQEFQAIKSARENALQPKGDLPRFTVPDMSPSAPGPTTLRAKSEALEKKSKNWLLDAMEKSGDARKDRDRGRTDPDRKRSGSARGIEDEQTTSDGLGAERETNSRQEKAEVSERGDRKPEAVFNPFTRYLGGWMTPADYALLKPGLDSALAGASPVKSAATPSPLSLELPDLAGGDAGLSGLSAPSRGGVVTPAPHENPYLSLMNSVPPVPTPNAPAVVPPPIAPTLAPASVAGPPNIPPAKSTVPDFAKPPVDEKYLKQLKKF